MTTHSVAALVGTIPLDLNSTGITQFIIKNIVPILLCVIGVLIIASARKGNYSGTMSTVGIVLIGIIVIVGAAGFVAFGKQLSDIVLGG